MTIARALQRTVRANCNVFAPHQCLTKSIHGSAAAITVKFREGIGIERQARFTSWTSHGGTQYFSTSSCLAKKGNKAAKVAAQSEQEPSKSTPSDDPTDFTALEAEIASTLERLKTDLSKLRAGGRFNPEILESLRVQPEKNSNETVRLNDLAQIIPKGRTVQILVSEKEYVKPVTTAIITSRTLNPALTPQPDPTGTNPLLLVVNVPPPTAESRKAAVNEAVKSGEKATAAVRDARGKQQKKLRAAEKDRSVRPDALHKASAAMEKVVEKGQAEVRRIVDAARKVLESG